MANDWKGPTAKEWLEYYRFTASRPPRDLLVQVLNHVEWERKPRRRRTAVELGFGAGTDTLELLRRGWKVVAIDGQEVAAKFLARRVPARHRPSLTTVVAAMEGLDVPPADLVYASFSLPFCSPEQFPALWRSIRRALRPGGHFAGVLFGDRDEWKDGRPLTFLSHPGVLRLGRGLRLEMLRETEEEGRSFRGPKHWHFFEVIFEKPKGTGRTKLPRARRRRG